MNRSLPDNFETRWRCKMELMNGTTRFIAVFVWCLVCLLLGMESALLGAFLEASRVICSAASEFRLIG